MNRQMSEQSDMEDRIVDRIVSRLEENSGRHQGIDSKEVFLGGEQFLLLASGSV